MRPMSAKHSKKSAKPSASTPPAPLTPAPVVVDSSAAAANTFTPWIDSSDPRKRTWGKLILAAVWVYVAALWLLALDQTFGWGIFGPKTPPLP